MVVRRSRTLYVNLRGAKDLEDIRQLFKMKVYVVASISDGTSNSQEEQYTDVDKKGKINPTWNYPMEFTINESAAEQTLVFQLWCRRKLGHKIIGEVCVPIGELLAIMGEGDSITEVSCPVNSTSGENQGKLMFLYSFHQITNPPPPPPPPRSYIMRTIAGIVVNVAVHAAGWFVLN